MAKQTASTTTVSINKQYNVFGMIRAEIDEFDDRGVYLIGRPSVKDQFDKRNRGRYGGYYYSQRRTLEALDLAMASKFKNGNIDPEGKRKTYMNIVNFHKEVAMNQINVNVSNYIMSPVDEDDTWPVFLQSNKFKEWAAENSYDDQIDDLAEDFCGRGTCVVKRTRNNVERVPLRTLRCTQTADSLEKAARNGGYVILESEMSYSEMQKYPGWKLDGLPTDTASVIFERYSLVPVAVIKEFNDQPVTDEDWNVWVLAMQIVSPDVKSFQGPEGKEEGNLLFVTKLTTFPLEEAHYARMDGRWMGIGEVEKQLENQIAKNLNVNLRHRSLLWHAKKIFQSTDDDVAQNLLVEVKDGEVLKIKPNGNLTQVNVQSQGLAEFNADEQSWDANSEKISFSFDTATGDNPPSGTPFRLGAILDAAVSKYFKRKQDRFSTFLKRSYFDQILPIFKKENDEGHTITYGVAHADYQMLHDAMLTVYTNELVHQEWMKGNYITFEQAAPHVAKELARHPNLFVKIPDDYYDDAHCYMSLNINEPIAGDVESLTTLYQTMVQQQDPRAENVLAQIFRLKGQNVAAILGPKPALAGPQAAPSQPQQPVPSPMMNAGNQPVQQPTQ